jgi:membrane protein YqaA with SNARE-associated domain
MKKQGDRATPGEESFRFFGSIILLLSFPPGFGNAFGAASCWLRALTDEKRG